MLARTWRRPSLRRLRSSAPAASSSSCRPVGLRQLDELEPELEDGSRQLREPRRERDADAVGLGARLAQGQRPPPRAAADEPRRERDLAHEAVAALGSRERRLDERAERAAQRQLVPDRLRELERLRELRRRAAAAHACGRAASRQAPGAPAVRPQSFGDGATREPGKLSKPAHSERFELVVTLPLERQQRQRQRCEELRRPPRRGRRAAAPAARPTRRRARRSAVRPRRAARPTAARPPRARAAAQARARRRAARRRASRSTRFRARPARPRTRRPRASRRSPPTPARPPPGRDRRGRAAGTSRAPRRAASAARRPAASAAAVTGPSSGSPPASGASAAGRSASDGCFRSAAFSSNPGMERQAIMGTYVLHEHTFPCQAGSKPTSCPSTQMSFARRTRRASARRA